MKDHYFLQCTSENRIHFSHEADSNALYQMQSVSIWMSFWKSGMYSPGMSTNEAVLCAERLSHATTNTSDTEV